MKFRWAANVIIVLVLILVAVYAFSSSSMLVVDRQGNVYTSEKVTRTDNQILLIEADAHTRNFYGTFWSFDHTNIEGQQKKASYLGGNIISKLYAAMQREGFYNDVRVNGYYVRSQVDSIDIKSFSFNDGVINIKVFGSMELSNNVFRELRHLDMELQMVLVDRILEKNPNGLSIEAINILSNETITKTGN